MPARFSHTLFLAAVLLSAHTLVAGSGGGALLSTLPRVYAHDAATTYLSESGLVDRWTKTQPSGGFSKLLDCGARAFDLRVRVTDDGALKFDHGIVPINHSFSDAISEVLNWTSAHSHSPHTPDDIIILVLGSCGPKGKSTACSTAVSNALAKVGITLVSDCSIVSTKTVEEVLGSSSPILAVDGCLEENYNPNVTCSGFRGLLPYSCLNTSSSKAFPLNRFWDYMHSVQKPAGSHIGWLYSHQALWQQSLASTAIGTAESTSLLLEEVESNLNAQLLERIQQGAFPAVNLFEINNVCDGGAELARALAKRFLSSI